MSFLGVTCLIRHEGAIVRHRYRVCVRQHIGTGLASVTERGVGGGVIRQLV